MVRSLPCVVFAPAFVSVVVGCASAGSEDVGATTGPHPVLEAPAHALLPTWPSTSATNSATTWSPTT